MGRQNSGGHVAICLPTGPTNSVPICYIESESSRKKRWDFNKTTIMKYLLASVVLVTCTRLLMSISNVWYGQMEIWTLNIQSLLREDCQNVPCFFLWLSQREVIQSFSVVGNNLLLTIAMENWIWCQQKVFSDHIWALNWVNLRFPSLRSLILVVVLVFGCIVVSFVLSSLKQRHDIESWTMMAGTAFNHLGWCMGSTSHAKDDLAEPGDWLSNILVGSLNVWYFPSSWFGPLAEALPTFKS